MRMLFQTRVGLARPHPWTQLIVRLFVSSGLQVNEVNGCLTSNRTASVEVEASSTPAASRTARIALNDAIVARSSDMKGVSLGADGLSRAAASLSAR